MVTCLSLPFLLQTPSPPPTCSLRSWHVLGIGWYGLGSRQPTEVQNLETKQSILALSCLKLPFFSHLKILLCHCGEREMGLRRKNSGRTKSGARRGNNEKNPDLEKWYLKKYWGQNNDDIIFYSFHLVVHTVFSHLCLMIGFIHNLKIATSFFKKCLFT